MVAKWLSEADEARIVAAIRRAEQKTSGEVRVHLVARCEGDPVIRAREVFARLRMGNTRADTGVLLMVAPGEKKVAVYAGKGVYGADTPRFWQRVVDAVAVSARNGELARGIERGVDLVGELLRRAIPSADPAGNELPDAVSADED